MTRQGQNFFVEQRQELNQSLTATQIHSLNLLAMPIQALESYIDECLLNNPLLEMDDQIGLDSAGEPVAPVLMDDIEDNHTWVGENSTFMEEPFSLSERAPDPATELPLRTLLTLQSGLMHLPATMERAVKCIISALDDDGYLRMDDEELSVAFSIPIEKVAQAVQVVQNMEPRGIAARSLGECLRLQTPEQHPYYPTVVAITQQYLPDLARNNPQSVAKALHLPVKEIQRVFGYLRNLDPYPGGTMEQNKITNYIVPDVLVKFSGRAWHVHLNDQIYKGLSINPYYASLDLSQEMDKSTQQYLRQRMNEANDLLRAVHRRHNTLLKLAVLLIRYQSGFLHVGTPGLKPLTMAALAEQAGVHPSTVTRAAAGKYIQTPRGIYTWNFFFPQALSTIHGKETTDAYVRMRIGQMIAEEDPDQPLSDQNLAEKLQQEGICIARRTVAKYRTDCSILPSNLRRYWNKSKNIK